MVRCSYRGDKLKPELHFDAENIAVHAVDRTTMCLLFGICAQIDLDMYCIDFSSSFVPETYTGDVPLYMKITRNFDETVPPLRQSR